MIECLNNHGLTSPRMTITPDLHHSQSISQRTKVQLKAYTAAHGPVALSF